MSDPLTPGRRADLRRLHEAANGDDVTGFDLARLRAAAPAVLPALLDAADERDRLRAEVAELAAALDGLAADSHHDPLAHHAGRVGGSLSRALAALARHQSADRRCPVFVGGEQCGRKAGHDGRHCWANGD